MSEALDQFRIAGMKSVAVQVLKCPLRGDVPPVEAYMFRAGRLEAAAVVFDALGDCVMAANMRAMAETWLKIARDA